MIRLLFIFFALLTIGLFIFSKIKPEKFKTFKEYSILHTLILIGAIFTGLFSTALGIFLSVIVKGQLGVSLNYFDLAAGVTGSTLHIVIVGLTFFAPFFLLVKYVMSFKFLANYIVHKLKLDNIIDTYSL